MGQEIISCHFNKNDFNIFKERIQKETKLLEDLFYQQVFSEDHAVGGFELEAWLIDNNGFPLPVNEEYLKLLSDPLVGAELASFNIELNSVPQALVGNCLSKMQFDFEAQWNKCKTVGQKMNTQLVMIGILPSLCNEDLIPENMSQLKRYRALNDQIMLLRLGEPIYLNIDGKENLFVQHADVMLEAATTSFQLQFQVSSKRSALFYNIALILSAPMVAAAANSPFMLNKDLWDETRIPVFEQSVSLLTSSLTNKPSRVTFGNFYVKQSLLDLFYENLNSYDVLLPMLFDDDPSQFSHLRLHNGTIWRWNRPIIGFDQNKVPHLRIEHRTCPAGPSLVDMVANAALFFGSMEALGTSGQAIEELLLFDLSKTNFYSAAKYGLTSNVTWIDGKNYIMSELLLQEIIPLAYQGLEKLGIDQSERNYYLSIIENRILSGQNGTAWQRKFRAKHRCSMQDLTLSYLERQESGLPVHEWSI